jgi:hypothetical protein
VAPRCIGVSNVWKASALVTPMHRGATMPPIRAPAFDGHGEAGPYAWPDDQTRRRPKDVHLCYPFRWLAHAVVVGGICRSGEAADWLSDWVTE